MKNLYQLSAALLIASFLLTGCFDEVAGPYDGPDQIAFGQVGGNYEATLDDNSGSVTLPTQLIGPQRSSEFEVNVSVLEERALRIREVQQGDGTTAPDTTVLAEATTAPAEAYSIPASYTFPASTSNVPLTITINDGVIEDGEEVLLSLRLDGNEGADIRPAENWRYFQITIVGVE